MNNLFYLACIILLKLSRRVWCVCVRERERERIGIDF